jgi:hypothetical protein
MYTLSLIYSYVTVCRFCVIPCVIIICFPLLFSNYWTCVFNIFLMFVFLLCMFVFYFMYSVFLYCFVYYFSFSICSCPSPPFVQVYRLLPLGGNPTAVNKCIISNYIFNSMWIYHLLTILRQEWMIYSKLQQSVQLSHIISAV